MSILRLSAEQCHTIPYYTHTCPLLRSPQQQQSKIPMMKINFTQFFKKGCCCVCRVSNQYAIPNSTNQNISFSTQLLQPMTSVHICKKTFPIAQVNHVFMALPRHTNGGVTSTLEATVFFLEDNFDHVSKNHLVEVVFQ